MKQKDILFIFISTFVIVVLWIGFNLYHKAVTSTINEDLQMQLNPIDPDFDMETFEKLKVRERITPIYELKDAVKPSLSPKPTPKETDIEKI